MQTDSPAPQDIRSIRNGLASAAAAAGYAPSIHNTQPWRWRLGNDTLDLHLHRSRVLAATDPDARLATLSCGAAMHHARTMLAAEGWRATIARMPDPADQEHLARLRVYAPGPADPQAVRHVRTIPLRHTDRRPVVGPPLRPEDIRVISATVKAEAAWLHVLRSEQIIELTAAAAQAQRAEAGVPEWRTELAYWTGATQGELPISAAQDQTAVFAILYGHSDEPRDWLRAGEALSAGWLTANERGVSVLPMGAPVEVSTTRDTMRRLLSYLHHPYLVLRFGTMEPAASEAIHAPRLPTDQIVERL